MEKETKQVVSDAERQKIYDSFKSNPKETPQSQELGIGAIEIIQSGHTPKEGEYEEGYTGKTESK